MAALEKSIVLKLRDGTEILVRTPTPMDTDALLKFDQGVKKDAALQGMDPDEAVMLPSEKSGRVADILVSEYSLLLIAEHDKEVIGLVECASREKPKLSDHVLRFYVSVLREYWGMGVGKSLLQVMMEWAEARGLEKISLSVLSSNSRAIRLYEKLGFTEEGRKNKEFRRPEGGYDDEIFMAKFIGRLR